jgi:hypothetical protein
MIRTSSSSIARLALLIIALCITSAQTQAFQQEKSNTQEATDTSWNYDGSTELPTGWKVEGTNQRGPLATWQIVSDKTAPSGENTLTLVAPNHDSGGTFNLFWTGDVQFLNGTIEVNFKALKGEEDQGGGVIWRAQDKDNYYIARFNPLEDNFRIYSVHEGNRKTLASAKIAFPAGEWHSLKIVQQGNRFQGYLNGKEILEGESDLFLQSGGVGLWTKADAVTSFDNFSVQLVNDKEGE